MEPPCASVSAWGARWGRAKPKEASLPRVEPELDRDLITLSAEREPAWHRRQRARRAAARTLLRVHSAATLLGGHHSAQQGAQRALMPGHAASKQFPKALVACSKARALLLVACV